MSTALPPLRSPNPQKLPRAHAHQGVPILQLGQKPGAPCSGDAWGVSTEVGVGQTVHRRQGERFRLTPTPAPTGRTVRRRLTAGLQVAAGSRGSITAPVGVRAVGALLRPQVPSPQLRGLCRPLLVSISLLPFEDEAMCAKHVCGCTPGREPRYDIGAGGRQQWSGCSVC